MAYLILGLIIFVAIHYVPTRPDLRQQFVDRVGVIAYRGLYSVVSLSSLALIIYGKSVADYIDVWVPPAIFRLVTVALMVPAGILAVANFVPGNAIKAKLGMPILVAVKVWAFAHLMANGDLASMILFGGFLAWAIFQYRSARRRNPPSGNGATIGMPEMVTVAAGSLLYGIVFFLHPVLFGAAP